MSTLVAWIVLAGLLLLLLLRLLPHPSDSVSGHAAAGPESAESVESGPRDLGLGLNAEDALDGAKDVEAMENAKSPDDARSSEIACVLVDLSSPSPSPTGSSFSNRAASPRGLTAESLEPLRLRDYGLSLPSSPSPRAAARSGDDMMRYAVPHAFEAADAASVLRLRVRLLKLDAMMPPSPGQVLEKTSWFPEHEDSDDSEEPIVFQDYRPYRPQTFATVTQPLQLYFHNSFTATPSRPLRLHFYRGSDVTAYRIFSSEGASDVPETPPRGPNCLVETGEAVELFKRFEGPGDNEGWETGNAAEIPMHEAPTAVLGGPFRRSRRERLALLLNSILILMVGFELLGSYIPLSRTWAIHCDIFAMLRSDVEPHYHPQPHPLLANLSSVINSYAVLPHFLPINVADLGQPVLDGLARSTGASPLPVQRLLNEISALGADMANRHGSGGHDDNGYQAEFVRFCEAARTASRAWHSIIVQLEMGWWYQAETSLAMITVAMTPPALLLSPSSPEDFWESFADDEVEQRRRDKAVLESIVDLATLPAITSLPDDDDDRTGSLQEEVAGLQRHLGLLVEALQQLAGSAAELGLTGEAECLRPRFDGAGCPTFRARGARTLQVLRCSLPDLVPFFDALLSPLRSTLEKLDGLARAADGLGANARDLLGKLPAPTVRFSYGGSPGSEAEAEVVGRPLQDGVWVRPLNGQARWCLPVRGDEAESWDGGWGGMLHLCVLYVAEPRAAFSAVQEMQSWLSSGSPGVSNVAYQARLATEAWKMQVLKGVALPHRWDVRWECGADDSREWRKDPAWVRVYEAIRERLGARWEGGHEE